MKQKPQFKSRPLHPHLSPKINFHFSPVKPGEQPFKYQNGSQSSSWKPSEFSFYEPPESITTGIIGGDVKRSVFAKLYAVNVIIIASSTAVR